MIGYIIVFFITTVPGLINRVQEAIYPRSIFVLFFIEACVTCSVGFLDSLVYGLRTTVRDEIKNFCFPKKTRSLLMYNVSGKYNEQDIKSDTTSSENIKMNN